MTSAARSPVWIAPFSAMILLCMAGSELPIWIGSEPMILVAVLVRLTCCAFAGGVAFLTRRDEVARSLCVQVALWTAIGGAVGSAIACALLAARQRVRDDSSIGDWIERESGEVTQASFDDWRALILDDRLRIDGAHEIQPLCDVLDGADQPSKLRALSVIARRFNPRLVVALRTALKDNDAAVRVMAASVFAKLQKEFSDVVQDAQAKASNSPDAFEAQIALANARLGFVRSGLLSAERVREEREKAAVAAMRVARAKPEIDAVRLALAEILLELSAYGEAAALLEAPFADEFLRARAVSLQSEAISHVGAAA